MKHTLLATFTILALVSASACKKAKSKKPLTPVQQLREVQKDLKKSLKTTRAMTAQFEGLSKKPLSEHPKELNAIAKKVKKITKGMKSTKDLGLRLKRDAAKLKNREKVLQEIFVVRALHRKLRVALAELKVASVMYRSRQQKKNDKAWKDLAKRIKNL